jgi:hypothetical protein
MSIHHRGLSLYSRYFSGYGEVTTPTSAHLRMRSKRVGECATNKVLVPILLGNSSLRWNCLDNASRLLRMRAVRVRMDMILMQRTCIHLLASPRERSRGMGFGAGGAAFPGNPRERAGQEGRALDVRAVMTPGGSRGSREESPKTHMPSASEASRPVGNNREE